MPKLLDNALCNMWLLQSMQFTRRLEFVDVKKQD